MFDLANVIRFVSFLTYLGFIVSSISGFVEVSKNFNLCELFICIIVLVTSLLAIFLQVTNTINTMIRNEKNILYLSAIYMFICSLLILGLSNIGIVFGVWGILMSIGTSVYAVFLNEDVTVTVNSERMV